MTASLSNGPVFNMISGSGQSTTFSTVANQTARVQVCFSLKGSSGNAGTSYTMLRSADGGATWTAISALSSYPEHLDYVTTDAQPCLYYLNAQTASGFATCAAWNFEISRPPYGFKNWNLVDTPGGLGTSVTNISASQLNQLIALRTTPLADSDIAPPFTMYKQCAQGITAQLSVPSDALAAFSYTIPQSYVSSDDARRFDYSAGFGARRWLRVSYAQVVSLVDQNGNAVSKAQSFNDPATIYVPGGLVYGNKDRNANSGLASSGPFASSTNNVGIRGFKTLLEAACSSYTPINPTALGL